MLHKGCDIIAEIEKAYYYAMEGRPGPVWLDIPLDLQSANVEMPLEQDSGQLVYTSPQICKDKMSAVISKLKAAMRPVVLIGSGVRTANAEDELKEFIEKFRIPLVYSNSAPDTYGSKNQLSIGSIGSMAPVGVGILLYKMLI